jgi:iron complex transport system substrate-binding protein
MTRTHFIRALSAAVALFALSSHAIEVVDDRGVTVRLATVPQRIVSVLPSLTETVCALGHCKRLVGVDRYSNWPESVKLLPKVGGGLDPNIEAIVALRPDVVLIAASSRAAERLESLGLKVVVCEPKTHKDVQRVIATLGRLLEVADAQTVWDDIEAGMEAAKRSLPASVRGKLVYFEVNRGPYGAGESSFIGETLSRLGVKNILPAALGPFPKINPEFVVRANPDVIMVGARGFEGMTDRPGWSNIRALREDGLCVFAVDQSDALVRPGPRMAEAAHIIAKCLIDKARIAKKP